MGGWAACSSRVVFLARCILFLGGFSSWALGIAMRSVLCEFLKGPFIPRGGFFSVGSFGIASAGPFFGGWHVFGGMVEV